MRKFWNWIRNEGERVLRLEGPIDEDSFWGDEITPKAFRDELEAETGDITVYINSPGGNVFAAAEIYTMLLEYKGNVTVRIDAIAASAASVIAMAGNRVLMSPVAMLMVHDPSTIAFRNTKDMEHAIDVLNEVKESIINAYMAKTHLTHSKIAALMSNETWINAKKAVELGFADEIIGESGESDPVEEAGGEETADDADMAQHLPAPESHLYSGRQMDLTILNHLGVDTRLKPEESETTISKQKQPVIGLDGKTKDGAMPYQILMDQLECLK